jgi:magnesium-transporting ATPase (P-type)
MCSWKYGQSYADFICILQVENVARILLTNLEGGFHASPCDSKELLEFQRLNEEKEDIQVVRGGCQKIVSILDLEPGDIVRSSLGGQVPADGIMVERRCLSIKSEKTGEHDPEVFLTSASSQLFVATD